MSKIRASSEKTLLTKQTTSRKHEEVGGATIDSEVNTIKSNDEEKAKTEQSQLKEAFGKPTVRRKKSSRKRKKRRPGFSFFFFFKNPTLFC